MELDNNDLKGQTVLVVPDNGHLQTERYVEALTRRGASIIDCPLAEVEGKKPDAVLILPHDLKEEKNRAACVETARALKKSRTPLFVIDFYETVFNELRQNGAKCFGIESDSRDVADAISQAINKKNELTPPRLAR